MQIDLTQKLKDSEGNDSMGQFKVPSSENKDGFVLDNRAFTLKDMFKTILLSDTAEEADSFEDDVEDIEISDVKKKATDKKIEDTLERYNLFLKIRDEKEVELSEDEADLICRLTVSKQKTLFAGQIIKIIKQK